MESIAPIKKKNAGDFSPALACFPRVIPLSLALGRKAGGKMMNTP
jgi:hypothetical protein